ncbi:MAG: helix-turn-helix transcriptional regulator [Bacteroidetes bacterium]|nr:helix-turn-helix transcriptional regulator [Bacteroidota bacterium]
MFVLKIRELLAARDLSHPHPALTTIGIPHSSATRLLNKKVKQVNMKHLELICIHYHCTPNDIFYWEPDSKAWDIPNHPLQKLRTKKFPNLIAEIRQMPLEDLEAIQKIIEEKRSRRGIER